MRRVLHSGCTRVLAIIAITFAVSGIAGATAITGGFGTIAAGVLTFANAGNTVHFIDWCPVNPGSPNPGVTCPTATAAQLGIGEFIATGGTGTFSSIPSVPPSPTGVPGTIKDMVDVGPATNYTTFPPGVPVSIDNFLTLSTLPQYNFRAQLLQLESCAPSATIQCIGPFILTQVGNNVSVSMTVTGTVFDTSNVLTPAGFTYIVTGQFNSTTVAAVAAAAQTTSGIFSNSWSGSLNTNAIPEPGTIYFAVGALLGGLGLSRRLRGRKVR